LQEKPRGGPALAATNASRPCDEASAGGHWLSHRRPIRDFPQTRARRKLALGAANGCLQGGAAAPKKILAGGSLEAVVCHAGSQAAGLPSAAHPTNSTTAKRLRLVQVNCIGPILLEKHNPGPKRQDAQAQTVEKGETATTVRSQRLGPRKANAMTASSVSSRDRPSGTAPGRTPAKHHQSSCCTAPASPPLA